MLGLMGVIPPRLAHSVGNGRVTWCRDSRGTLTVVTPTRAGAGADTTRRGGGRRGRRLMVHPPGHWRRPGGTHADETAGAGLMMMGLMARKLLGRAVLCMLLRHTPMCTALAHHPHAGLLLLLLGYGMHPLAA